MKNFHKKAGTVFALLASSLVIIGCGGISESKPQSVSSVKSIYNLGDCTPNLEDQLVYVESENSGYVCTNGDWVKADERTPKSSTGNSSYADDDDIPENNSSSGSIPKSSTSKASWAYLNPNISYGEIIDKRDGQVYKTVVIGKQTWMAENLNFAVLEESSRREVDSASICLENKLENCDKYGRFYFWETAMKGICPSGWHLPDSSEFIELLTAMGGIRGDKYNTMSWPNLGSQFFRNNEFGFSVISVPHVSLSPYDADRHNRGVNYWKNGFTMIEENALCGKDPTITVQDCEALLFFRFWGSSIRENSVIGPWMSDKDYVDMQIDDVGAHDDRFGNIRCIKD